MAVSFAVASGSGRSGVPDCAAPSDPVGRDTILLVEDNEIVALLLMQVLKRIHWRVLRAGDGAEGERMLVEHGPAIALALVDCGLPDADGADLCQRLRLVRPGLPVLLTSGREQSELAQALAADGPAAFLAKPFLTCEVTRQVQNLVAHAA